jgi:quercetin dioxygenase-like cupin family protein
MEAEPMHPLAAARFDERGMSKATLARSERLMVGLNCFLAGQEHAPHRHQGQDKLYHVLAGRGRFRVGAETFDLGPGDLVLVPGGVEHGVANPGPERLVVLVALSPPPGSAG